VRYATQRKKRYCFLSREFFKKFLPWGDYGWWGGGSGNVFHAKPDHGQVGERCGKILFKFHHRDTEITEITEKSLPRRREGKTEK
jgi:hypothetical protein